MTGLGCLTTSLAVGAVLGWCANVPQGGETSVLAMPPAVKPRAPLAPAPEPPAIAEKPDDADPFRTALHKPLAVPATDPSLGRPAPVGLPLPGAAAADESADPFRTVTGKPLAIPFRPAPPALRTPGGGPDGLDAPPHGSRAADAGTPAMSPLQATGSENRPPEAAPRPPSILPVRPLDGKTAAAAGPPPMPEPMPPEEPAPAAVPPSSLASGPMPTPTPLESQEPLPAAPPWSPAPVSMPTTRSSEPERSAGSVPLSTLTPAPKPSQPQKPVLAAERPWALAPASAPTIRSSEPERSAGSVPLTTLTPGPQPSQPQEPVPAAERPWALAPASAPTTRMSEPERSAGSVPLSTLAPGPQPPMQPPNPNRDLPEWERESGLPSAAPERSPQPVRPSIPQAQLPGPNTERELGTPPALSPEPAAPAADAPPVRRQPPETLPERSASEPVTGTTLWDKLAGSGPPKTAEQPDRLDRRPQRRAQSPVGSTAPLPDMALPDTRSRDAALPAAALRATPSLPGVPGDGRLALINVVPAEPPALPAREPRPLASPIQRTSAKEPAPAPRAVELELVTRGGTHPLDRSLLVVARLRDAAGRPVPEARLDWSLDPRSTGEIVAVSDAATAVTMKPAEMVRLAAVVTQPLLDLFDPSSTGRILPTFARGRTLSEAGPDDRPGRHLRAGDGWCRLEASAPGDMLLTVVAPDVADQRHARRTLRIHWHQTECVFPEARTVAGGGAVWLATQVRDAVTHEPLPQYPVRYEVPEGAHARLASGAAVQEVLTGADGVARIAVVQRRPVDEAVSVGVRLYGRTSVGVESVVLDEALCRLVWQSPQIRLNATAPEVATTAQWVKIPTEAICERPPEGGLELVAVLPREVEGYGGGSEIALGPIEPLPRRIGQGEARHLAVRADQPGLRRIRLEARDRDGRVMADRAVAIDFVRPRLDLAKELAGDWREGHVGIVRLHLHNPSAVPVAQVTVRDQLPPGVAVVSGIDQRVGDEATWTIDEIPAAGRRTIEYRVRPRRPVPHTRLEALARADGILDSRAEAAVAVAGTAVLELQLSDLLDPVPAGDAVQYDLRLSNRGSADCTDVRVHTDLPAGAKVTVLDGDLSGRFRDGVMHWRTLDRLAAGASVVARLRVTPSDTGDARLTVAAECAETGRVSADESTIVMALPDVDEPRQVSVAKIPPVPHATRRPPPLDLRP